jgi:hypothetical protein
MTEKENEARAHEMFDEPWFEKAARIEDDIKATVAGHDAYSRLYAEHQRLSEGFDKLYREYRAFGREIVQLRECAKAVAVNCRMMQKCFWSKGMEVGPYTEIVADLKSSLAKLEEALGK